MDPHGVDAAANDQSDGNSSDSSAEEDKAIREVIGEVALVMQQYLVKWAGAHLAKANEEAEAEEEEEETEEETETEEDEEETETEEDEEEAEAEAEAEEEDGGRKKGKKEYDDEGGLIICRLSDQRRVTLTKLEGETLVSITEHDKRDGKELPTAQGISLTADEWASFKKNVPDIEKTIKMMESRNRVRPGALEENLNFASFSVNESPPMGTKAASPSIEIPPYSSVDKYTLTNWDASHTLST
ncbi:eukaryotic translation initiation factor 3 subunit C-like [Salvia hispanica]|uniref:eukaryotic translation initiation factor 3 subunit C-like n=1 Tax=Salvia hispanica TaxID=49212 RepID=UPI0020092786|nr:eukaryotic translation initiation factor 3 subunit C-like [Salvia hispanica]